jgi:hypothetical protein
MTEQQTTHIAPSTRRILQPPQGIEPDFAAAAFWRTAIWCVACDFSCRQCDLVNSQVHKDDSAAIKEVFLHMVFPESSLPLFSEYLASRIKSLDAQAPAMPVVIGLSNRTKGVIRVENSQVSFDPEGSLQEFPGLETMAYGNTSHERRVVSNWDERVWCHVSDFLSSCSGR